MAPQEFICPACNQSFDPLNPESPVHDECPGSTIPAAPAGQFLCPACKQNFEPLNPESPVHDDCPAGGTLVQMPEASRETKIAPIPSATPGAAARPPSTRIGSGSSVQASGQRGELQLPDDVKAAASETMNFVGHYILVSQVGRGGMGVVWKAWDRKLARYIAIKFLTGTNDEDLMRFEREARLAAGMRHPNIAPIYEIGDHGMQKFIAMEYITGTSLEKTQLSEAETISIMHQICLAVDHAHQNGVIHRDLKPANIMLTKEKWPYVLDFGLAKMSQPGSTLSADGMITGTPSYMPPEQAQGLTDKIDARSDVYSLGATLYQLFAAVPPHVGKTAMETVMKVINEDVVPLRTVNPKASEQIELVVHKALSKDPLKRYQTAAEMAADLKRFSQGEAVVARPPSIHSVFTGTFRRNPVPFMAAGMAMLLALGIGITMFVVKGKGPGSSPTSVPVAPNENESRKWRKAFENDAKSLTYSDFKDEEAAKAALLMTGHLENVDAVTTEDLKVAHTWFKSEIKLAETKIETLAADKSIWLREREAAAKVSKWAVMMLAVLKTDPFQPPVTPALKTLKESADKIVAYRGKATIRIFVLPYATLKSLKSGEIWIVRDGKITDPAAAKFSSDDLTTPLVIQDLEVAATVVELTDPGGALHELKIPAESIENGKEYALTGSFEDEKAISLKSEK